jgi:hypothetical protein
MNATFLFLVSFLTVSAQAQSGSTSVRLGRLVVEVGLSSDELITRAANAKQYLSVPKNMSPDTIVVWENEVVDNQTRMLGSVVLKNGVIQHIFKKWTPEQPSRDTDVGNAIFSVASDFLAAHRTQCTLATRVSNSPGQQEQTVTIACGRHAIDISTVRNDEFRVISTDVTEWVH